MAFRRMRWLFFVVPILGVGLGAWAYSAGAKGGPAWKARPLRLGYADEAPFAFDGPDGRVTGAWPEVARRVLANLGAPEPEFVRTEFSQLLDELNAGRIDIVVMGMFITPARKTKVAFSRPTAWIGTGLLVKRGNPKGLKSFHDLAARPDVTLALLDGAVEAESARAAGVAEARFLLVPDVQAGAAAVKRGKADALALTGVTVRHLAASDPDQALEAVSLAEAPQAGAGLGRRPCGYAFRRGDEALQEAFDRELGAFMATPAYERILAPFGFLDRNLPAETRQPETTGTLP